jgi:alginate O-acetyltransferase complex protein AlgI
MWHGAGWNFILWGLYFAVFLVGEKFLRRLFAGGSQKGIVKNIAGHIYLVVVIMISFLIFNADSLSGAWSDIVSLVRPIGVLDSDSLMECSFILKNRIGILLIGIIGATPMPALVCRLVSQKVKGAAVQVVKVLFVSILFVLCTAYIIDGSFNPFLYFRF